MKKKREQLKIAAFELALLAGIGFASAAHVAQAQQIEVGPGDIATEWSGGHVTFLKVDESSLPVYDQFSIAYSIDESGRITGVGVGNHFGSFDEEFIEWKNSNSEGSVISPGSLAPVWALLDNATKSSGLPGSVEGYVVSTNALGQSVGYSFLPINYYGVTSYFPEATEWSGGQVIDLGAEWATRPKIGWESFALSINNSGQIVGWNGPNFIPESSTWIMMLLGFAGLGAAYASRRRVLG
jgi:hypothetical protein